MAAAGRSEDRYAKHALRKGSKERCRSRPSPPLQHAHLFQPPQPFSKQRARDMRKTALKLIEVIHVGKKLADDQDCPAIGKNLRRTCDTLNTSAPSFN